MDGIIDESWVRRPHPALRRFVGDYVGYDFAGFVPGVHRGMPSSTLTFIITINDALEQWMPDQGTNEQFDVLIAGLHLRSTLIPHEGHMAGVQIGLTPFAPRCLFGLPAAELAGSTVDLADISRPLARELHERVNAESAWPGRFTAIDEVLLRACVDGPTPRAEVLAAWDLLTVDGRAAPRSAVAGGSEPITDLTGDPSRVPGSGVRVSEVAEAVGWSRRHLSSQLRAEIGLGPKDVARIVRFDRARRMIARRGLDPTDGDRTLADIAALCGFTDQSHLNREFTSFTGLSPISWLTDDAVARGFHPDSEQ